jgi:DNA-binding transcriptional regulator YdaS (Cro superfamily)
MDDDFIFTPSVWLGQGKISFSSSSEFIKFYTKWEIARENETPNILIATQVVELIGVDEPVVNTFTITEITPTKFVISLENASVGKVIGTGLRNENLIAWEFVGKESLEGFEVYEKQENGDYFFHAEYGTSEFFRTFVEGLVWRKEVE